MSIKSQRELKRKIKILREIGSLPFKVSLAGRFDRKLTPAQKGIITKRFKEYKQQSNRNTRFIPLKHLPNESKASYNRRLKQLKHDFGQSDTNYKGIVHDIPAAGKLRYKKGKFEFGVKGLGYREVIVPIDPEKIANPKTRTKYLRELIKKHSKEFGLVKAKLGNSRSNFTTFTNEPEMFTGQITAWLGKYGEIDKDDFLDAFTSLIFIDFGENSYL